jgi:flagellar biosynthesis/type III secretory pathway protein FliH
VFIELPKLKYLKGRDLAWPILKTLTLKTLPEAERHADAYPETRDIINRQIQISSDKKMWEEFRIYEKSKRDIRAIRAEARDKLVEKGMKMGMKEGEKEGEMKMIQKWSTLRCDSEFLSRCTENDLTLKNFWLSHT